jgi:hypothetical protein
MTSFTPIFLNTSFYHEIIISGNFSFCNFYDATSSTEAKWFYIFRNRIIRNKRRTERGMEGDDHGIYKVT